ncbi:MAG: hypothetical protein ABGX63_05755 [bacterium]
MANKERSACWMWGHIWEITKQDAQPSAAEQLAEIGGQHFKGRGVDLFTRDVITQFRCTKCGKEKVERI